MRSEVSITLEGKSAELIPLNYGQSINDAFMALGDLLHAPSKLAKVKRGY